MAKSLYDHRLSGNIVRSCSDRLVGVRAKTSEGRRVRKKYSRFTVPFFSHGNVLQLLWHGHGVGRITMSSAARPPRNHFPPRLRFLGHRDHTPRGHTAERQLERLVSWRYLVATFAERFPWVPVGRFVFIPLIVRLDVARRFADSCPCIQRTALSLVMVLACGRRDTSATEEEVPHVSLRCCPSIASAR